MIEVGRTSLRVQADSMPPRLAMLLGAGLLAVGCPPESHGQMEMVGKSSSSPLELIAPGRTLTVIVPSREAETRHAGTTVPLDSSQLHRVLIRRFAEEHYLHIDWVQVDDWDALVPTLIAGQGDLVAADVTITKSRKAAVAFTVPTHRTREHIVVREGDRVESMRDLVGREISIREHSSFREVVQRARHSHPDIGVRFVAESTPPESLLEGVAEGRLDMAAVDVVNGERFRNDWPSLRLVSHPFESDAIAWAVNPHAPNLLEALDRFLSREQVRRLVNGERYGDLSEIKRHGVLRVITRNNAVTFFLWRGEQVGFEYELLREFARRHGLHLEVIIAPQHASLFDMLERGAGDVAAASLPADIPPRLPSVVMTHPFNYVYDYLVARHDDDTILGLEDLNGRAVTVRQSSVHWHTLEQLRDAGLKVGLDAAPEDAETEALIAAVGEGRLDLTMAASHVLDVELGYRTDVRKAFILRGPVPLGWAVRRKNEQLLAALNEFLEKEYRGLFFNVVHQKYFENPVRMRRHREDRVDHEQANGLSPYDTIMRREAATYGFDWTLLVAQMYQESRFDPKARSPSGAAGLMQLMPRTAREFGVKDRYDHDQSIRAGVGYLAWLHSRFEPELSVKDRFWFALAAYNAGFGHVRDARQLARELGLDPNRWFDNVEEAMLLLSKRTYYRKASYGYVRGYEVVKYVREIRERYRSYLQTTDVQ